MRFPIVSVAAFTFSFFGNNVAASSPFPDYNTFVDYVPYINCLKLVKFIEDYNQTVVIDMWRNKVCSTGCKPNVADYESEIRPFAISMINTEAKQMNLGNLAPTFVTLMDRGYDWFYKKCGSEEFPDGDLCSQSSDFAAAVKCARDNWFSFFKAQMLDMIPLISDATCKKELDYFSDPAHMSQTVPMYLEQYVKEAC